MSQKADFKKIFFKIFIVLIIAVGAITIFKGGYKTGNWLYEITHK